MTEMDAPGPIDMMTRANLEFARKYPGDSGARQPVHVLYGGAHLFRFDSARRMGAIAEKMLDEYAPDAAAFAKSKAIPKRWAARWSDKICARVREKLRREPVEDLRIDFEDGYGFRPDAEEDAAAESAAREVAKGMDENTLPPFIGIRIKALNEEMKRRSFRTLDMFMNALLDRTGGQLPRNFCVTLPKITVVEQVNALIEALDQFRDRCGEIPIEIMVETPQALFILPQLVEAARSRCVAAHFGPYDYTASVGLVSVDYSPANLWPAAWARSMMQATLAGTGVRIADGPISLLPIPVHRGEALTQEQIAQNRSAVQRGWATHYMSVESSLRTGFFQSWDVHPAQLVSRYQAVYVFFMNHLKPASERLHNFIDEAAQATAIGGVFDDAAMGQAMLNFFLRGINCGAIEESEVPALTGLSLEELRSASFAKILEGRRTAV